MVPELGQFSLVLALLIAILQSIVPILGASRGNSTWMNSAKTSSLLMLFLVSFSFIALVYSYIVSDFTVLNVVNNSHSDKPMLYKVVGTWGNHEGSILLWVLILVTFGAAVAVFGGDIPSTLKARTLSVQAWISVGFISFILFTSNPFERVFPPPLNGNELNPLLQDIGLAIHPPLLYFGYVGFSIVFSFAVAALIEGNVEPGWARIVRPWILVAWTSLSGGVALGSWWAYYELGWGGWWFWDPVENVSLMPWLIGTALLHSAIVTEKRGAFKAWTILLSILTFSLSLLGTFIVRSGLLTSVHSFAVDPERGIYILILLALSIGGSLVLFAFRGASIEDDGLFSPISRESGLLLNNLLLVTCAGTVLFGTMYPLFLEAISGEKISVGPPFFNITFVPIALILCSVMVIGPYLNWKKADLLGVLSRLRFTMVLSLFGLLVIWYLKTSGPALAILSFGIAIWLLLGVIQEWIERVKLFDLSPNTTLKLIKSMPRASHGMTISHMGISLIVMGAVASSAWRQESVIFAELGQKNNFAGFTISLERIENIKGPNYISKMASIRVENSKGFIENLYPERRVYPVAGSATTESAIRQTLQGDLYISFSEAADKSIKDKWTLRLIYEPLVNFIWLGAILLMCGGFMSLSDRRFRRSFSSVKKMIHPIKEPS